MSDQTHSVFDLPPRRETFLARYPRNLKMVATVVILACAILPPAFLRGYAHHHKTAEVHLLGGEPVDMTNLPSVGGKVVADPKAPALNDQNDRSVKLLAAPDARINQDDALGSLPRTSEDGMRPWQLYARPFNSADKRPRVAIVIVGLGMSRGITDQAINQLPPTVTLSFLSDSPVVGAWGQRARQDGHEILLQIPSEPFDYPNSDPGPDTLLTMLPNSDNLERLLKSMRRATGYVGITSVVGTRFTADTNKLTPMLEAVNQRGLMVFDARSTPHSVVADVARNLNMPVAVATQRLDSDLAPDAINEALDNLEKTARQSGRAIGVTAASPLMITQLQAWANSLPEKGIALAPLTAMVQ
jgi:polysaccharide deacetylase 2 family uncharacterized protein YibQ